MCIYIYIYKCFYWFWERENNIEKKHWSASCRLPTVDWAGIPGACPHLELDQRPLCHNEPQWPGRNAFILMKEHFDPYAVLCFNPTQFFWFLILVCYYSVTYAGFGKNKKYKIDYFHLINYQFSISIYGWKIIKYNITDFINF